MVKKFDLNNFADGGLMEKFSIEMQRVLENVADPNTDPKKVRKVTLTVSIKPNANRTLSDVTVEARSTIAPAKPISTELIIGIDSDGKVVGNELKSGMQGQSYIDDEGEVRDDTGKKIEEEKQKSSKSNKVVGFK